MNKSQKGITILEIIVALSLGAFMLVGIISMMASVSSTRTALQRSTEQMENGRYAVQIVSDDLALAGFWGPYFRAAVSRSNPSPCVDDSTLADLGVSIGPPITLPTAISGFVSGATLPTTCIENARTTPGTTTIDAEVLIVRHVSPSAIAAASAVDGVPYMQISFCATENDFVFSNVAANFILSGNDCVTTGTRQPVWSYEARAYYVANCDDCTNGGDGIPTLKVVEFANGQLQGSPISLVEGVEDMHIVYGLDIDGGDGVPDCFVDDPAAVTAPTIGADCTATTNWSAVAIDNWANVVAVDIYFLVRSLEAQSGWTDTKTYDLGRANRSGPFNDGFKRQVFKASVMLQNVAGPRE